MTPRDLPTDAVFLDLEARAAASVAQDPRRAMRLARAAWRWAQDQGQPLLVARAQALVAAAHLLLGQLTEAQALLGPALAVCEAHGDLQGQARCLNELDNLAQAQGRYAEALGYASRLLALAADRPQWRAQAHSGLASVMSSLGDLPASLEHQLQAIAATRASGDEAGLAMDLSNVSVDYRKLGQFAEAAHHAAEGLELARESGNVRAETAALHNLGQARLEQGRADEARALFVEQIALARRFGLTKRLTWGLQGLAEHSLRTGEPGALPALHEALDLSRQAGLRVEETDVLQLLGRAEPDPQARVAWLAGALALARESGNPEAAARAHRALSEALEAQGQPGAALAHLRASLDLQDARERSRSAQRAEVLAARFGADEARRENQRLLAETRRLQEDASRDALTGLANRRGLDGPLAALLERVRLSGEDLCLAMLDLDHFKAINDRFSHAVGDAVLQSCATLFRESSRSGDLLVRYGGEEFVLVQPGLRLDTAHARLEQLRSRVQAHPWSALAPGLCVTVSVGVAQAAPGSTPALLLAAADACLYQAKRTGRNQTVCEV